MNCPKCQYNNHRDAFYCGLCYLPFNKYVDEKKFYAHRLRSVNAKSNQRTSGSLGVLGVVVIGATMAVVAIALKYISR